MTSLDLSTRRRRPTDRRGPHSREPITAFREVQNPVGTAEDRALAALRNARGAAQALAEMLDDIDADPRRTESVTVQTPTGNIVIAVAMARRILAALREDERPTINPKNEGTDHA